MLDQVCIHCYISGKVQNVWFRATTKEKADQLGLTGWVRNLSDGRVEVLACGTQEKIKALYDWLKQGPPLAEVKEASYEELTWQVHTSFEVR